MSQKQFAGVEERALDLLERAPWGDVEFAIADIEVGLALLCEALAPWMWRWEEKLEETYGDEFLLTREQVKALEGDDFLSYVARLVETVVLMYGLSPEVGARGPGRSREGVTPPLGWRVADETRFEPRMVARLVQGLNDLLDQKRLDTGAA